MILGDPQATQADPAGRATLDDIFRHAAARRPDALALADPPDRQRHTDGAARQLTYAQADRMITAIAGRLGRLGLPPDAVVALHLPHTVEGVLAFLAVLRAGLIAAPLPLLWRRSDAVAALRGLNPKVIITSAGNGRLDHSELAMRIAADMFAVRYVCAFGSQLPDGMLPLSDLFKLERPDPPPPLRREHNPAAHVALITWDLTPEGLIPVARNHLELVSGGLAVMLEGRLPEAPTILSPCPISSFAGIAVGLVPWLLTGGTLCLHQPFDADAFERQCIDHGCDTVVLPGPLASRFAEAGLLRHEALRNVLALWRAPERVTLSPAWQHPTIRLVDVLAFGETAVLASRREDDGWATTLSVGKVTAPRGAAGAVLVAELGRTGAGTLAMRGPMVPQQPFPAGEGAPQLKVSLGGLVDTGYACRLDRDSGALTVTGPPPGVVTVGGYRFLLRELQDVARRADLEGAIAALPDALGGHRLAGMATDRAAVQAKLVAMGVNPLIADAFGERRKDAAAA
jgi:acyl-CoA synthetase (AMP-forming)/AMP-acid ligase II